MKSRTSKCFLTLYCLVFVLFARGRNVVYAGADGQILSGANAPKSIEKFEENIFLDEIRRWDNKVGGNQPGWSDFQVQSDLLASKDTRCSRYCVQERDPNVKANNGINRIKLLLSTADNAKESEDAETNDSVQFDLSKHTVLRKVDSIVPNCQVYLTVDCDKATGISNFNKQSEMLNNRNIDPSNLENDVNTVRRDQLFGNTEAKIHVNQNTTKIQFTAWGNISQAILEIPASEATNGSALIISLTRLQDSEGMNVETYNAPPGVWLVKLSGVEKLKYSFRLTAEFVKENYKNFDMNNSRNNKLTTNKSTLDNVHLVPRTIHNANNRGTYGATNKTPGDIEEETEHEELDMTNMANLRMPEKASNERLLTAGVEDKTMNFLFNFTSNSDLQLKNQNIKDTDIRSNSSTVKNRGNIQGRSAFLREIELYDADSQSANLSTRMIGIKENDKPADIEKFAKIGADERIPERKLVLDLNVNSDLIVRPGTIHRIVFDITNNHAEAIRCIFKVRSMHFRIFNLQPLYVWVYAGQTNNVVVDVVVPRDIPQDLISTLTLFVEGTEITEKSVYLYAQGSICRITDEIKPTISYSFNSNCAGKLDKNECEKTRWSVDITVQDAESGLKSVKSTPNQLIPRTDFISGTKNAITFYYSATCCSPTVKITAVDLFNNYNIRTIDVTAWNNLTQGEIAAIVLGVLLFLLLIILLIVSIVYCFRKKKSENLPYTQRYAPQQTRTERTSF